QAVSLSRRRRAHLEGDGDQRERAVVSGSNERIEFYVHDLGEAELASVRETLGSVFLTLGPKVARFEERFADFLDVPHVVGVNSCSMALVLGLRALGIGPGDEVITTPLTFVA